MEAYEKQNIFLKNMEVDETEEEKDEAILDDEDLAEVNLPEEDENFDDDEEDLLAVDPLLVGAIADDEEDDDDEYIDFDTFDDIDE